MKTYTTTILIAVIGLAFAHGQFGPRPGRGMGMGMGGPQGPHFDARTTKLFGENSSFSATMEMSTKMGDNSTSMPGKLAFDQGKSRFEMDMSQMKSSHMSPQAAAQMKSMGMDKMVMISRPDLKVTYAVYPGMQAYVENPMQQPGAAAENAGSDMKVETTELGKETVDGHPCVKNKVTVTDKDGKKSESTVWNATDLKNFPVKIETTADQGTTTTMAFKDVQLTKPDASQFDPPSGYTKAANMMELMMKRGAMGGGFPPARPPQQQ